MVRVAIIGGIAVALVALAAWAIALGVPLLADHVARTLSPETEAKLGESVLQALDSGGCRPSTIDAARQSALRTRLTQLGDGYRLELRSCPGMDPNAMALPGSTIVVTDELIRLAQSGEQLAAVLAHEMGHVRERHAVRTALQRAGITTTVATFLGDTAGLADALRRVLLQTGYPLAFEDQADAFALQRMRDQSIPPRALADMLQVLERYRAPVNNARIEGVLAAETDFDRCIARSPALERHLAGCASAIVLGKLSGPQLAKAYATRGELYSAMGAHQAAVEDLDKALASGSRDPEVYNTLAWLLATSTQDGLRNGQRAKELALTACELTRYQEPNFVDTLAAAHAEAGEFDDAIRLQQRALESPEFEMRFGMEGRSRLELYAARRPYREGPR
ncbi:MAG: M48 family metalloprotease [Betaproteobacteria bacterium]|nr:M48 family metalloprotease [Betaproteobacteria bacterium]